MILILSISASALFISSAFLLYKNFKLKSKINNKYIMDKFIIDNFENVHNIKLYMWSVAFKNVLHSRLYEIKAKSKTLDDRGISELTKKFIERCNSIFGDNMIDMIIRTSYYGDSDAYVTDAIRYFYDKLYSDETYNKINGHI